MKNKVVSAILAAILCFSIIPVNQATAATYTLKNSYEGTGSSGAFSAAPGFQRAETFTANGSYWLGNISIHSYAVTTDNNVTISLYAAAANHTPTGSALSVGVPFVENSTPMWRSSQMSAYYLSNGVEYAIVVNCDGGTQGSWTTNTTGSSTNYHFFGTVATHEWTSGGAADAAFRVYEVTYGPTVTTSSATLGVGYENLAGIVSASAINVTMTGFLVGPNSGNYTINQTTNQTISSFPTNFSENITGLTPGTTYFYKAQAFDGVDWGYGAEYSFIYSGYMSLSTVNVTNANLPPGNELFIGLLNTDNWSGNVTTQGFQVGSANGTWDFFGDAGNTLIQYSGAAGYITSMSGGFANNVTYWYRPFAGGYDSNGVFQTFYGAAANFTESNGAGATAPVVSTLSAYISTVTPAPFHNPQIVYNGGVTSSTGSLVRWGFVVSNVSAYVDNISAGGVVFPILGTATAPFPFTMVNDFMPVGIVYYRAFAQNQQGLIGYGSTMNITNTVPGGGVIVVTGNSTTFFNSIHLNGIVNNPSGVILAQHGFQWGNASNNLTNATSNISPNPLIFFTTYLQLTDNYTIYWRAGVLPMGSANWTWSTVYTNTVGQSANATLSAPTVITHLASNTTANSFTTTIEFLNTGSFNVTEYGIEYRLQSSGAYTRTPAASDGNFSAGNYTAIFSGFTAGQTVYYRAYAINSIDLLGYGRENFVVIGSDAAGGTGPVTGGFTKTLSETLRGLMATWGMDNTLGHWAFMGIWMLVVFFIFITLIIYLKINKYGEIIIKACAALMCVLEIVIVGGFVLSGMLGLFGVILMVIIAGGFVLIFGNKIFGAGESRGAA